MTFVSLMVSSFLETCLSDNSATSEISPVGLQQEKALKCSQLLMGQYICDEPAVDPDTQQAQGCSQEIRNVSVDCRPAPGIVCDGREFNGTIVGFHKKIPCNWTSGHSFETALLLSIFLGMFGIDRFYLGYPAIGLLKFCTLGFMFLGQLMDILLIATQVVKPSDGSEYVIDYYGAKLLRPSIDNYTYYKPQDYS